MTRRFNQPPGVFPAHQANDPCLLAAGSGASYATWRRFRMFFSAGSPFRPPLLLRGVLAARAASVRRTKAVAATSVLILVILAYVAWCARGFYLRPRLVFPSDMPEEARHLAEAWHAANGLPEPMPWTWERFGAELFYPFSSDAWPSERFASLSQGEDLFFIINHRDVTYGIKGRADESGFTEMIARGDLFKESELGGH